MLKRSHLGEIAFKWQKCSHTFFMAKCCVIDSAFIFYPIFGKLAGKQDMCQSFLPLFLRQLKLSQAIADLLDSLFNPINKMHIHCNAFCLLVRECVDDVDMFCSTNANCKPRVYVYPWYDHTHIHFHLYPNNHKCPVTQGRIYTILTGCFYNWDKNINMQNIVMKVYTRSSKHNNLRLPR